jgi:hypothetical protein
MQRTIATSSGRRRLCLVLAIAGIAIAGLFVIGASPGAARDAFVAGGRSTGRVALDEAGQRAVLARAEGVGRALGLPAGVRRTAIRVDDRFDATLVDEVTTFDAAGRPLSVQQFRPDGTLRTAVRLGWSTAQGNLTGEQARTRAMAVLADIGIRHADLPSVKAHPDGRGWTVAWPRRVAGVPVRGDGTWVRFWADGSIHSVAVAEAPLAPAPARILSAPEARRSAEARLASWSPDGRAIGSIGSVELAWVAPNDTFEPSLPDAPAAIRRLAWIARVTPSDTLASRMRAVELYIDAGDGRLLGGDVLE